MSQYKLTIDYRGTTFSGWQSQPDGVGVQDHVEGALSRILNEPTRIVGASRTDAGVHARGQVACFRSAHQIADLAKFLSGLNKLLRPEISPTHIELVADDFHPIRHAVGKVYVYRVWLKPFPDPMRKDYWWHVPYPLDRSLIMQQAGQFLGKHDFTSFCAADASAQTKTRTIDRFVCDWGEDQLVMIVTGRGFLKQMVRTMVGTIIDIGRGQLETSVDSILKSRDRAVAGITAPAHGLMLEKICYDEQLYEQLLRKSPQCIDSFRI